MLYYQYMGDQFPNAEEPQTTTATDRKLGLGVKVLVTAIVVAAIAGGVYAAFVLAR